MRVERFAPEHLRQMENLGGQEWLLEQLSDGDVETLVSKGNHYTLRLENGTVIACTGVVPLNRFRGVVWQALSEGHPETFTSVALIARRLLHQQPFCRLDVWVDPFDPKAVRWARLMGFEVEVPFRPYLFPDGRPGQEWAMYLKGTGA